MTSAQLKQKACAILASRCTGAHTNGYVARWEDNLLPGLSPKLIEADLRQGSGKELDTKFRALHSSSALAANTFGPFKSKSAPLVLAGQTGFKKLSLEKKLDTGLGGTPPNLDVWLEADDAVIAIESKFLEPLSPTQAKFVASYTRAALPQCDNDWWQVLEEAKLAGPRYLNAAQLTKHALGLLRYKKKHPTQKATLLYLFWEPTNAAEYDVFCEHRRQLRTLKASVQNSDISFEYMGYPELWSEWQSVPALRSHVAALQQRYDFAL